MLIVASLGAAAGQAAQGTGTVEGSVSGAGGQPLAGTAIVLAALGDDTRHETTTGGDGSFRLDAVSPGQYSVSADLAEVGGQIFRVLVQPGATVDVRFLLERGETAAPWLRGLRDDQASVAAFEAGVRANRAGNYEEAIAQFEATLRLLPACVDCRFNIGVAASRLGRFDDAEAAFNRALRVRPDYAAAYYGLADVYSRQGRDDEAAEARSAANRIAMASLAAGRARARDSLTRGIAFLENGNLENAIAELQTALGADATLNEASYWLGRAYLQQGDTDAARRSLARYVGTSPEGEHAEDARRRLAGLDR